MLWEILPGKLWQANIFGAIMCEANLLISCSPLSGFVYKRRSLHLLFPFLDVAKMPDIESYQATYEFGAFLVLSGKKVVVNCNQGCNRSGLVIGGILHSLEVPNVVDVIKKAHPGALYNETFVAYLENLECGTVQGFARTM